MKMNSKLWKKYQKIKIASKPQKANTFNKTNNPQTFIESNKVWQKA